MSEKPVFLTREGLQKLTAELDHLRTVRRPQVATRIHQSKEFANTVDNAEYDDAKNEQAFVEGRILTLEQLIKNALIIDGDKLPPDNVHLGSTVVVQDEEGEEERYHIVGSAEADPRKGKISNESPVGRALLGRRIGDKVEVVVPSGVVQYTVLEIR